MTQRIAPPRSGLGFPHPAIPGFVLVAVLTASSCGDAGTEPASSSGTFDGSIAYVLEVRGEEHGSGSHHVVVRTLATGEERVVLSFDFPSAYIRHLAWSRDGNGIVVGLSAPISDDLKRWDSWLARYSPDGSGGERVFDQEGHYEEWPALSCDGRLAYYGVAVDYTASALFVDGTSIANLFAYPGPPAWLPGGEAVLVSTGMEIGRVAIPGGEVTTITLDDGWTTCCVGAPQVSSAGRIAFTRSGTLNSDIWIAEADGSQSRRIIVNGHSPAWSPDGAHLVYSREWIETRVFTVDSRTDQFLFRTWSGYSGRFVWLPSSL
jgi:hypothetical protein